MHRLRKKNTFKACFVQVFCRNEWANFFYGKLCLLPTHSAQPSGRKIWIASKHVTRSKFRCQMYMSFCLILIFHLCHSSCVGKLEKVITTTARECKSHRDKILHNHPHSKHSRKMTQKKFFFLINAESCCFPSVTERRQHERDAKQWKCQIGMRQNNLTSEWTMKVSCCQNSLEKKN